MERGERSFRKVKTKPQNLKGSHGEWYKQTGFVIRGKSHAQEKRSPGRAGNPGWKIGECLGVLPREVEPGALGKNRQLGLI